MYFAQEREWRLDCSGIQRHGEEHELILTTMRTKYEYSAALRRSGCGGYACVCRLVAKGAAKQAGVKIEGVPGRLSLARELNKFEQAAEVLQSPATFPATLTPMDARLVEAMVSAIAQAGISLPGVNGDATTAAGFAGHWSERRRSAVTPFQGSRLYEWLESGEATDIKGALRRAISTDRSLMIDWTQGGRNGG